MIIDKTTSFMQLDLYINEANDYARDFFGSFIHNPSMRVVDFPLYFCSVVLDD